MIEIRSEILKSAMLCKAKNDVRYYLNNLYIDYDEIVATNGHICFKAPITGDEQRIINFQGKIPSTFEKCIIENDSSLFYDKKGNIVAKLGVETIDARYPDYNRLYSDKKGSVEEIGISGIYLETIGKISKLMSKHSGCRFQFQSSHDAINICIGDASIVLMPMRVN